MANEMEVPEEKQKRGTRSNQKLKILYLAKILLENTDANYDMTLQEIIDRLAANNVTAEKKSNELIKKIEHLASKQDAAMLQRQVYVAGRVKTMNNAIMENVDAIHNAIARNLKISFQYFQWNVKKEPELRKNGARYVISPWGLSWDDENYYMVGYDADADMIKHYRVDKMLHIRIENTKREGRYKFKEIDMAAYGIVI